MKYVYVIRYIPSGLWVCSRDNRNKIKIGNFGSCKVFVNKPDIDSWFNMRYPIHIIDYQHTGIMSHRDFEVRAILLTITKEEILKPYYYFTYCTVVYLFKLPVIISIGIYTGITRIIEQVKQKIKVFKDKRKSKEREDYENAYQHWLHRHERNR